MEIFTLPISFIAFILTLWITSFFARLMSAKQPSMLWILATWLLGSMLSVAPLVTLRLIVRDASLLIILTYLIPLVIFSIVYRVVNNMDWIAAITTNITAVSIAVISTVIVIIALGKPLDKTIITIASQIGIMKKATENESLLTKMEEETYDEKTITAKDLLADKVIAALEEQQKRRQQRYIEPQFQIINTKQANGAVGYTIRLVKKNGTLLQGILSNIIDGQLIVKQTLHGGIATTPITMHSIKTLEVYR
jgi:hypothetical protein